MAKPDIDVTVPVDSEIVGEGAQRIRETRQAVMDVFPINPDDLDWEWTANHWPAGSLTGGMDPSVDNENPPTSDEFQDRAFLIGDQTLKWDYMIPPEHNAISPGPLDTGPATVTVPDGSTWTVVGNEDLNVQYLRDLEDVSIENSISGDALIYDHSTNSWYAQSAPQGPQGNVGPQGPQGVQGDQGVQGVKGDQGVPGPQGHDGQEGSQGPQGNQGPQGGQGSDGKPGAGLQFLGEVATVTALPGWPDSYTGATGDAYYVLDTGEIWAWGTDSAQWVNLGAIEGPQGPDGIQGPKGDQGIQGETGPQGGQGPTGGAGPEGPQGVPGSKGDTGLQGPQGIEGQDGERGQPGPKGDPGLDYQYDLSVGGETPEVSPKLLLTGNQAGSLSDVQLFAGAGIGISGSASTSSVLISNTYNPAIRGMITMWGWNDDVSVLAALNDENWFLCDGGTNAQAYGRGDYEDCPDMINYFVRGGIWGDNVGTFAGSDDTDGHTLSQGQIPSHNHGASSSDTGSHSHTAYGLPSQTTIDVSGGGSSAVARGANFPDRATSSDGSHSHSITVSAAGGGQPHSHGMTPLHIKVAYIIYLGAE